MNTVPEILRMPLFTPPSLSAQPPHEVEKGLIWRWNSQKYIDLFILIAISFMDFKSLEGVDYVSDRSSRIYAYLMRQGNFSG
jgi:hypothetical protein